MSDWSDDAKNLMCGLFFFGHGTVKTSPPHATLGKNKAAFDELLTAGLITREAFNDHDVWVFKPTQALEAEAENTVNGTGVETCQPCSPPKPPIPTGIETDNGKSRTPS